MKFQIIENKENLVIPSFNSLPLGTCFRWAKDGLFTNLKISKDSFIELMIDSSESDYKIIKSTPDSSYGRSNVFVVDATLVIKE